jgi:hypothetical protein
MDEEDNHVSIVEYSIEEKNKPLTKAERKAQRLQASSEWKTQCRNQWNQKSPNIRHTMYYSRQLPGFENELSEFHSSMASDLPVAFRTCHYRNDFVCQALEQRLRQQVNDDIFVVIIFCLLIL